MLIFLAALVSKFPFVRPDIKTRCHWTSSFREKKNITIILFLQVSSVRSWMICYPTGTNLLFSILNKYYSEYGTVRYRISFYFFMVLKKKEQKISKKQEETLFILRYGTWYHSYSVPVQIAPGKREMVLTIRTVRNILLNFEIRLK